ncbi:hypothetical protein C1I60_16740 [Paenibacillus terrae]|uniref:Uncharacterized protein n=1 Tax=Paenibacillus terrae TaxID=159743 RepID=A0A4U2PU35_9BACL|nr:hypothetical protein C1I60_16740 [Paenibacillus terrae]
MNPSFQKLFHGDYCHLHTPPKFGFFVCPPPKSFLAKTFHLESTLYKINRRAFLTPSINIP